MWFIALTLAVTAATQTLIPNTVTKRRCRPQVLSAVPDVAAGCQELPSLLRYLGLKPGSGSREAAEPL